MTEIKYESLEDVLDRAKQAEGQFFSSIATTNRIDNLKNKGALGQIIEEDWFGYSINSNREADFAAFDTELKVTPIKKLKNGNYSAKERLVLSIINYMEDYKEEFTNSSFLKKSQKLLLMFYLWEPQIVDNNYQLIKTYLLQFSETDLQIIENDWTIIMDKIKAGKAHELTEADTFYLAACTKGSSAQNSLREQPFSNILAKQRAYSMKTSYMTTLVRKIINDETFESLYQVDSPKTLEDLLFEKLSPFFMLNVEEIKKRLNLEIKNTTKNFIQILISKILGISGTDLNKISEFNKANIKIKTIRLLANGTPKEHMSFPTFKFMEIVNESWEESRLYKIFSTQKFLFIIFQFDCNNKLVFKGFKLWNMPYTILENEIKNTWLETVSVIKNGVILEKKNGRIYNNFPTASFNNVCHVRPHAQNAADTYPLPDGRLLTKQCFWLDKKFIKQIISE